MNITKQIASEVAVLLLQEKQKEINSLKKNLDSEFTEIVLKTIPIDVLDFNDKFPDYLDLRSSFQCMGNGFNYKWLNTSKSLPCKNSNFLPNPSEAKKLLSIIGKIGDKKKVYNELLKEIEVTLFSLRTYKRVEESFPEAFILLPNKTTTAVALNISDLRQKIK